MIDTVAKAGTATASTVVGGVDCSAAAASVATVDPSTTTAPGRAVRRLPARNDTGGRRSPPAAAVTGYSGPMGSPVRRNEPCPCGGGRKFKHCHGRRA